VATHSPLAHPHLFVSAAELPALRAKAGHPALAEFMGQVIARAEAYLDPSRQEYIDLSLDRTQLVGVTHSLGHTWRKLPDLLLLHLLTGEARWTAVLTAVLRTMTQDPSPMKAYIFAHAPSTNHDRSMLGGAQRCLSTQCGMIPLMYDCLYDQLSAADRLACEDYLRREVVEPYLNFMLDAGREPGFGQHLGINIGWWEFYAWLWSLAAIYDPGDARQRRGLELSAERIRLGLHMGADAAGVIGEGPGYASIEIFSWWSSAEVLRRLGVTDFWVDDARFRQVMKARLYYLLPGARGILDHGDTGRDLVGWYSNSTLVMLLHAQRTGDPVYQAGWEAFAKVKPAKAVRPNIHGPPAAASGARRFSGGLARRAIRPAFRP
jgi:hypothetical protein